jgi:hypothetical protein
MAIKALYLQLEFNQEARAKETRRPRNKCLQVLRKMQEIALDIQQTGVKTFEKIEKNLKFSTGGMLSELWAMFSRSQKFLSLYTLTCTHAVAVPNE